MGRKFYERCRLGRDLNAEKSEPYHSKFLHEIKIQKCFKVISYKSLSNPRIFKMRVCHVFIKGYN